MKRTYTILVEEVDGKLNMNRTNDGFSAFELLGFASLINQELIAQIHGTMKPIEVERNVIVDKKKKTIQKPKRTI